MRRALANEEADFFFFPPSPSLPLFPSSRRQRNTTERDETMILAWMVLYWCGLAIAILENHLFFFFFFFFSPPPSFSQHSFARRLEISGCVFAVIGGFSLDCWTRGQVCSLPFFFFLSLPFLPRSRTHARGLSRRKIWSAFPLSSRKIRHAKAKVVLECGNTGKTFEGPLFPPSPPPSFPGRRSVLRNIFLAASAAGASAADSFPSPLSLPHVCCRAFTGAETAAEAGG